MTTVDELRREHIQAMKDFEKLEQRKREWEDKYVRIVNVGDWKGWNEGGRLRGWRRRP